MSKKKRKKPASGGPSSARAKQRAREELMADDVDDADADIDVEDAEEVAEAPATSPPARRERRAAAPAQTSALPQHPPVAPTLARGLAAAGSSPATLAIAFLALLGLWASYTVYGIGLAPSAAAMVLLESLPPVHNFLDLQFLAAGRVVSTASTIAFGVGLILIRSILMAMWIALALDTFAGRSGAGALRRATRRAFRSLPSMIGIEAMFTLLAIVALFVVGGILGQLGFLAGLVGGTYFLIFSPVVAVTEGLPLVASARLAARAARLPGPRHVLLSFGYVALTLFTAVFTPGSRVGEATPSILVWAYAMFVSFLHVGVLAAFTYRWLLVRDPVLEGAPPARRPMVLRRATPMR